MFVLGFMVATVRSDRVYVNFSTMSLNRFRLPAESPDTQLLDEFLGNDYNGFFSSVDPPTDEPSLAVERLTVEGSGGVVYIE